MSKRTGKPDADSEAVPAVKRPAFALNTDGDGSITGKAHEVRSGIRIETANALDTAKLSLELMMVGMAVDFIPNIQTLHLNLSGIEAQLMQEATEMETADLAHFYFQMAERLEAYMKFCQTMVKDANWSDIEQRLNNIKLQARVSPDTDLTKNQIEELAVELVKHLRTNSDDGPDVF